MRNFKKYLFVGTLLSMVVGLSSCSQKAKIDGTLTGTDKAKVVVALLDVNKFKVLDTLETNAQGHYSYKLDVQKGQPEFVYLYYKNTQIGSLILQKGENCKLVSDTLGNFTVTGSPESEKMAEVSKDQAEFNSFMIQKATALGELDENSEEANIIKTEISRKYVDYYRSRIKYLLQNSHSLSCVNVLYQSIGDGMPIFSQVTDAIHFRNVADSLKEVYPESKYVKALNDEAERRERQLEMSTKIQNAQDVGFLDLNMPNIEGKNVKLSDLNDKVIMLYFWTTAPEQNLLNSDVIKPIYDEYHSKGFEIYAVCVDTDKTKWASVVKNQHMNWINVCDGLGAASPAVATYAVQKVPTSFLIVDGTLSTNTQIKDEASLRRFLNSKL